MDDAKAKITDYGILSKDNKPSIFVKFKCKNEAGEFETLFWYGGFTSDKAKELTKNTMKFMGFKESNAALLARGIDSRLLDIEKVYDVSIQPVGEYNGKVTPRKVAFVNTGDFANKLSVESATKTMAGMNLESLFMTNHAPESTPQDFNPDESIPF